MRPGAGHTHCSIGAYEAGTTACVGDCNGGNGQVTSDDLLTLLNVALGNALPPACPHGIPNGADANVVLTLQAVNHAVTGTCGGS